MKRYLVTTKPNLIGVVTAGHIYANSLKQAKALATRHGLKRSSVRLLKKGEGRPVSWMEFKVGKKHR